MDDTFEKVLAVIELLEETGSAYNAIWYGIKGKFPLFMVDYDDDGTAVRIQLVGTYEIWHRE